MTAKNVLVILPVTQEHKTKLEEAAPAAAFSYRKPEEVTEEEAGAAHIIIGSLPLRLLPACRKLAWLQLHYAGIGKYGEPGILPEGALLTNASGAYGETLGEYLTAMLLHLMKKFYLYRDNQNIRLWKDMGRAGTVMGSRVLVAGLGDIGLAFARRVHALGGRVTGIRRNPANKPEYVDEVYTLEHLDALLPKADVVAMCLPDTPLTKGLISRERLAAMKEGAYFLNVGRGNAVDSIALTEALVSGHLAGAAVDVTEPEPLPAEHPLWAAPNTLITPHVAGWLHLTDLLEKTVEISRDNLKLYFTGQPLYNIVDTQAGYRQKENQWKREE